MKFCLIVLALLPFALSAKIDERRFIENLLGGIDSKLLLLFKIKYLL